MLCVLCNAAGLKEDVRQVAQSFASRGVGYMQHIEDHPPVTRSKKVSIVTIPDRNCLHKLHSVRLPFVRLWETHVLAILHLLLFLRACECAWDCWWITQENVAYYRIAVHYQFALTKLFNERGYPRVIILEDDMEISPVRNTTTTTTMVKRGHVFFSSVPGTQYVAVVILVIWAHLFPCVPLLTWRVCA